MPSLTGATTAKPPTATAAKPAVTAAPAPVKPKPAAGVLVVDVFFFCGSRVCFALEANEQTNKHTHTYIHTHTHTHTAKVEETKIVNLTDDNASDDDKPLPMKPAAT